MNVKTYRIALGLTQEQLAAAIDVPKTRLSKWEQQKGNPKPKDDRALRNFFLKKGILLQDECDKTELTAILMKARHQKALTQIQIAKKLKISLGAYRKIEEGTFPKNKTTAIEALDKLLEINLCDLLYNRLSTSKHIPFENFMEVPYVAAHKQASYIKALATKDKQIDNTLDIMLIPKEFEEGIYMVVDIEGDSMDDGTKRAICSGDKLLIKEIDKAHWAKIASNYKNNVFVLFTKHTGITCKQITQHHTQKGIFSCQCWNSFFSNVDVPVSEVYRLFYVKYILHRKIKL